MDAESGIEIAQAYHRESVASSIADSKNRNILSPGPENRENRNQNINLQLPGTP